MLERIKEIARNEDKPDKDEVEHLKSSFYRFHIAEREKRQKDYLEAGGDPEKYQILPDDDEETFKAEMQIIKEKRAKAFQEQEAEKQANLQRKLDIIEKIKAMATSPEEANKNYNEFKELQKEFKDIKSVPPEKANEVWRNYQLYVEQFYDLLNLNREAREYDFKKNLEAKTKLCEEAEALDKVPDVVSAFHQLQELHAQYREIGPVAKDLREQIWARFKAASTVINKKHQQHFEELRAKEEENLAKKTELCEKVEALAKEENKGIGDWEKHSKAIIALQQEWKTIGFAPQKMNVKIFERFRAACDDFFSRKSEFFKQLKQQFAANAEKKRELSSRLATTSSMLAMPLTPVRVRKRKPICKRNATSSLSSRNWPSRAWTMRRIRCRNLSTPITLSVMCRSRRKIRFSRSTTMCWTRSTAICTCLWPAVVSTTSSRICATWLSVARMLWTTSVVV